MGTRSLAVLLVVVGTIPLSQVSARQWTSHTGKHTVRADLVWFDGITVHLRKPSGETLQAPLAQLSLADRQFLWTAAPQWKADAAVSPKVQAFTRSMHAMRSIEAKRIEKRIDKLRPHLRAGSADRLCSIGQEARNLLEQLAHRLKQLESPKPFIPMLSPKDFEVGQIGKLDDDLQFTIQADPITGSRQILVTFEELRFINRLPGNKSLKLRNSWHKATVLRPDVFVLDTDFVTEFSERQLDRILDASAEQKLRSDVYEVVGIQHVGETKQFLLEPFSLNDVAEWMKATTYKPKKSSEAAASFIHPRERIRSLIASLVDGNDDQSPVERGRIIFERSDWNQRSREFNARSCADCHHLLGIGGAGEEQFNARSVGIEQLRVPANTTSARLAGFLSVLHPRFVDASGTMTSVIPLPHFGGPSQNNSLRMKFSQRVRDNKDLAFGPASHQQLLQELSSLPGYVERNTLDPIALTAKSFQRNTPALFGLGLIDAVSDEEIRRIARRQVGEPGISGRPATLSTGRIGRFGWRANVATLVDFTRQACVNELGIQVQSDPQASPSGASRRSTSFRIPDDISLGELESLTAFISGLTAPERMVPQEIASHQQVLRGEQLFEGIGCSICHIPNIGEAEGIYSDLLLHDMGFDLRGASTADPYIQGYHDGVSQPTFVRLPPQSYYGRSATLPPVAPNANSSGQVASRRNVTLNRPYQSPPDRIQFAVLETHEQEVVNPPIQSLRGGRSVLRQVKFRRNRVSPTNVSQEWRTPPLWGLRDSAPYLHDGRAATVHEAIMLHAGESLAIRNRYALLHPDDQNVMVAFLNTFVAPANALRD